MSPRQQNLGAVLLDMWHYLWLCVETQIPCSSPQLLMDMGTSDLSGRVGRGEMESF